MHLFDLIVLVDDDPINNLINKRLLNKLDLSPEVVEFLEAEKALKFIAEDGNRNTLILLDINMPVMNGWDFLTQYAELEKKRKDKIVMLSSSIDHQDIKKSREFSYVHGFIEKPLTRDKLTEVL